jgi:hypothetical protein
MDSPTYGFELGVLQLAIFPSVPKRGKPASSSKALVPSGIFGSTIGLGKLTQYVSASTVFTKEVVSQLVGHLLGDGSLSMTHTSVNPYFIFTQTIKQFELVWFVFTNLLHYCNSYPKLMFSRRKGKIYPFLQVHTRSYPYLTSIYNLFYQNINGKMVKTIDYGLLPYLDDIALAYWAMDDGAKAKKGFYLHTKGFTYAEVYKLVAMLHYQFQLNCTVQNHESMPVIYIRTESMPRFVELVRPHFHQDMMYKLP